MKKIRYILHGNAVEMDWSETNEEIAKAEADNIEEIKIFDDGQPEPETKVTTDEVLDALLGVM